MRATVGPERWKRLSALIDEAWALQGQARYALCSGSLPFGPRAGSRSALEPAVPHQQPRRLARALQDDADTQGAPGALHDPL